MVNHKRVERIWREEGLKVPKKQPKRRPALVDETAHASGFDPCTAITSGRMTSLADRTHNGRPLTDADGVG